MRRSPVNYRMRELYGMSDGVRIHALEWSPDPSTELGLPLVFVGGGTANALSAEVHGHAGATGRIGGQARRVLGVSRRGTGLSEAPAEGYTPRHFAGDVRSAIEAAGFERFVLFGHSMGVPISIEFALRFPQGLAGLALGDAPAHFINFRAAGTFGGVLDRPLEFPDWDAAFEAIAINTGDRRADRLRFDRIRHRYLTERGGRVVLMIDRAALERTVEESVDAETLYWERLPEIRCPVLLVVASEGWSPMQAGDIERYEKAVPDLTVIRLKTGHDLGQGGDVAPLHAALGRSFERVDHEGKR